MVPNLRNSCFVGEKVKKFLTRVVDFWVFIWSEPTFESTVHIVTYFFSVMCTEHYYYFLQELKVLVLKLLWISLLLMESIG